MKDNKVILVLVDGMRPDSISKCGNDSLITLAEKGASSFEAQTVMPSVTLPCHASLFFSVEAERHGILTNTWTPQVRPIIGLGDAVAAKGKRVAMFYNWEELRDLNRPGTLVHSHFQRIEGEHVQQLASEQHMTDLVLDYVDHTPPDLLFLYLGYTDCAGHKHGWMGQEYLEAVANASACIQKLHEFLPDEYSLIVTADHGGHNRSHGSDAPEDMNIPIICYGSTFTPKTTLENAHITDIAPTIAKILNIECPSDWEGQPLCK